MTDQTDQGDIPTTITEKYRDEIVRWGVYQMPNYDEFCVQVVRYTTLDGKVMSLSEKYRQEYLNDSGEWVEFDPKMPIEPTLRLNGMMLQVLMRQTDILDVNMRIEEALVKLASGILDPAVQQRSGNHETEMQEKGLTPDAD